jgi:hypothetical protein
MKEKWKLINSSYNYMVSNKGRVRSLDKKGKNGRFFKGKLLNLVDSKGYRVVNICSEGKRKINKVHRLVAEAFIDNPVNKPCVNHINGIKHDNRVENLEWCTVLENNVHCYNMGLNKGRSLFDEIQLLTIYTFINKRKTRELCELYGRPRVTIQKIKQGKSYKHFFGRIFNECV